MLAFEYYILQQNTTAEVGSRMSHSSSISKHAAKKKKIPMAVLQHAEAQQPRFYGKRYRLAGFYAYSRGIACGPADEITCICGAEERC